MSFRLVDQTDLDPEWVELIMKAKEIGLSVEEIREFLRRTLNEKEVI
ncbi:anti-repressor SinI family protein [Bacillus sp. V5-8f]|nr:anti-repressor SinI family protein [Bacillus sp. V5-8f]